MVGRPHHHWITIFNLKLWLQKTAPCILQPIKKIDYQIKCVGDVRPSNIQDHITIRIDLRLCTHGDFIMLSHWDTRLLTP